MKPSADKADLVHEGTAGMRKTLVILTPGFPKDEADSTCLPAQQLFVKTLNRCFPQLQVILLSFEYPFSDQEYTWHGNRVIPLDGWDKGRLVKIRVWITAWRMLNRLRRSNDLLGLLCFWCSGCSLVGTWFGRLKGLPHFTWILGQDARNNRYIPFIRPRAEELVAMSDSLATEFHTNYGILPRHIVTNGIETSLYRTSSPDAAERNVDVLGAGSLIPLKQYDQFLSVIRRVADRWPGVRSVICGKGPEEAHLRDIIRELRLEDHVKLAGERSHDEVLRLMQCSRVFLHTSSYEGFSTVCLEALYAGAHVVSLCRPMSSGISNWHIASRLEDMPDLVLRILDDPGEPQLPALVYTMENSARKMMRLFDYG